MFKSFEHLRILSAVCSRGIAWLRMKACGWMIIQRCYDSYGDNMCNFFFLFDVGGRSDERFEVVEQRFQEESRFVGSDTISQPPSQTRAYHQVQIDGTGDRIFLFSQISNKSMLNGCNRHSRCRDPNPTNPGNNGWTAEIQLDVLS
jgi:hypothetical protein